MKSIRISDEAYLLVQREAALMSRSIAQQFEHWVRLGRSVEAGGLTSTQVKSLLQDSQDPEGRGPLDEATHQAIELIAGALADNAPMSQERLLRRAASALLKKHFAMGYGDLVKLTAARRRQLAQEIRVAEVRGARKR